VLGQLAVGILLSGLVAGFARKRGSLSDSGVIGAIIVGAAIYSGGGLRWFAALLLFFATSTLLGRVGRGRKEALCREYSKGDTRDLWQVLANGGVAALCGLLVAFSGDPGCAAGCLAGGFVGALATASGDTWATEIGPLSSRAPRSLIGLHRVPAGTSGAVSGLGLGATAMGGGLVGLVFGLWEPSELVAWTVLGGVSGAAGAFVDSLLGARLQARFFCDRCARSCEGSVHHCGARSRHTGGLRWFSNDAVNLVATICGATLGALLRL